jgi:hypothetical protein
MDDPTAEKAKACWAILILYVMMAIGIGLPVIVFIVLRRS